MFTMEPLLMSTRLLFPLSAPCISSTLKPIKAFHKTPNFNTHPNALIQESRDPNPILLNNAYSPLPKNFMPTRPLDPKRHFPLSGFDAGGSKLKEKIFYLELIGVDTQKALRVNPSLLSTSLHSIKEVVHFLQQMGVHSKGHGRIFGMCPQVLTSNIEKDLVPAFNFLIDEVKVPRKDIRNTIYRTPQLLVSSVRDELRPTLFYLRKLGFSECPNTRLLVKSVEKSLIPKLEYLQSLGIPYKRAAKMVVRNPGIFASSVDSNLQPKFDYLIKEMGGRVEDLVEFPQYLAFSLEKRIKPRHRHLVEHNASLPLPDMLKKSDKEFLNILRKETATNGQPNQYQKHLKEI